MMRICWIETGTISLRARDLAERGEKIKYLPPATYDLVRELEKVADTLLNDLGGTLPGDEDLLGF